MNQGWTYTDTITPKAAGLTVLDYYTHRYRHSSCADWQRRIDAGQIQLNQQPVRADTPLQTGQTLVYHRPPWEEPAVPLHYEVLYEDEDLLLINKPSGLPVLPGGDFLDHTLLALLERHYPNSPPIPIHRLGRGTSGVMLLARSPLARSVLSRQLRESTARAGGGSSDQKSVEKTYLALVGPSLLPDHFTMTTPIGKVPYPVLGYVYGATPAGHPAYSEGRVVDRGPEATRLAVTIHTGRPHQIRIHLAAAGYPLLGDPLYTMGGVPYAPPEDPLQKLPVPGDLGYFLHAHYLRFLHPQTGKEMTLRCPAPW